MALCFEGRNPMKDLFGLLDAIHEAFGRPEYAPGGGLTHCNQFTSEVCGKVGFSGLDGLLANDIVKTIAKHPDWSEVAIERAQDLANAGSLVIAGFQEDPHGHVAVVCPGKMKTSGRWGDVPTVASVGQVNQIRGLNWAFSSMPTLWAWRPTL